MVCGFRSFVESESQSHKFNSTNTKHSGVGFVKSSDLKSTFRKFVVESALKSTNRFSRL